MLKKKKKQKCAYIQLETQELLQVQIITMHNRQTDTIQDVIDPKIPTSDLTKDCAFSCDQSAFSCDQRAFS